MHGRACTLPEHNVHGRRQGADEVCGSKVGFRGLTDKGKQSDELDRLLILEFKILQRSRSGAADAAHREAELSHRVHGLDLDAGLKGMLGRSKAGQK